MRQPDETYLRLAIEAARKAREHGNHPFGAVLVDREGNVLLEAENTVITERDCTGHAETNLMRLASQKYDSDFLAQCTLYASTEPCAMCASAIYWGGVGRVVFALSAAYFYKMLGGTPELALPCRDVLAKGQRPVEVVGPVIEQEAWQVHAGFWK